MRWCDDRHKRCSGRPPIAAIVVGLLASCCWLGVPAYGQATVSEEVREFEILVKDKPAGKSTLRISDLADGTTNVVSEVHVKLNYLVFVYRYDFSGQEKWRGARLLSSENRATDDGKKFDASAKLEADRYRIEANGRARGEPVIDMTTDYWRAPEMNESRRLTLMNADRGTIHTVRVERLAPETLTLGMQQVNCSHYRFTGDVQAELWYDGQNRLVRQKSVEDGYPTELRLTRLNREMPRTAQNAPLGSPPLR
ncbi:MAG TPA: DUF6134 family protein [Pirellulales bacterium]|nr:DUF6134 family protein [Pirellulales bacterium]